MEWVSGPSSAGNLPKTKNKKYLFITYHLFFSFLKRPPRQDVGRWSRLLVRLLDHPPRPGRTPLGGGGCCGRGRRSPERRRHGCTLGGNFFNCSRIGNRSLWGSGRPRWPRRPFQKVGGFAPSIFWSGPPGPRGRPHPQNDRCPILKQLKRISHPKCRHWIGRGGCGGRWRSSLWARQWLCHGQ